VIWTYSDDIIKVVETSRRSDDPDAVIKTVELKTLLKKAELRVNPRI